MGRAEDRVIDAFQKEVELIVDLITDEAGKADKADIPGMLALFDDLKFMRDEWTERERNPIPIASGSFATGYRPAVSPEYITRLAGMRAEIANDAVNETEKILKARKFI